jgi:hypothetical protein
MPLVLLEYNMFKEKILVSLVKLFKIFAPWLLFLKELLGLNLTSFASLSHVEVKIWPL